MILRITVAGALFLASIAVLPFFARGFVGVSQLQLSAAALLIVVGVALDTMRQLEAQLLMRRYERIHQVRTPGRAGRLGDTCELCFWERLARARERRPSPSLVSSGPRHISSGDLFREEQEQGTALGKLAKGYMDRGELVPNEVTIKMILGRIQRPDCAKGFILDGFPRNLKQAAALGKALDEAKEPGIDAVVYMKVANDELLRRLGGRWMCQARQHPYHVQSNPPKVAGKCDIDGSDLYQRLDDSEETARRRLQVYFQQTAPLIEFLQRKRDC